ncbi:MAG: TVP38/TMEM64 family protein, partial [Plesiomonas sp.]
MMRKLLLTLVLVALIALYLTSDLPQYLTFDQLKASQQYLLNWQAHAPLQAWVSVFVLYIVVVALSLPGATIMTLAAGALFGLGSGLLLVSFASTIGATLAFLVARYLFKAPLESRFPQRLAAINDGLEKEGAFYLLTLRLVPLFPFFLVNILLGLTRMKTRTYYWVSQLGMLPATVVYTNAGTQLAQLHS